MYPDLTLSSNLPAWKAAQMLGIQERNGYARFVSAQMYYSLLLAVWLSDIFAKVGYPAAK